VQRFATVVIALLAVIGGYSPVGSQSRTKSIRQDVQQAQKVRKEIAVTFDELPFAEAFVSGDHRAIVHTVIDVLQKHHVRAVGFAVGNKVAGAQDLLGEWLNASHGLGNLSYSHHDINDLSIEQFITDIRKGADVLQPMLDGFGQQKRYFRYPYLHYGSNIKTREEVGRFLSAYSTVVAHASVVVEDYVFNLGFEKLGRKADSAAYGKLRAEYVAHVMSRVADVEKSSQKLLQRQCRQILQLRMNRLNGAFLDDLLSAIEGNGYKFITLDAALSDPVYQRAEAYYGARGRGYLDMIADSDPDLLPAEESK